MHFSSYIHIYYIRQVFPEKENKTRETKMQRERNTKQTSDPSSSLILDSNYRMTSDPAVD